MNIDLPTFTVTPCTMFGDTPSTDFDDLSLAYEFANGCANGASIYMDGELVDTVTPRVSTDPFIDDLGLLALVSLF